MVEPVTTITAVSLLAACLGGALEKAGEQSESGLVKATGAAVSRIHEAIRHPLAGDSYHAQTLQRFEQRPEDDRRQRALQGVLDEIADEDPEFAQRLADLVAEARKAGGQSIQITDSGVVAIGGNVIQHGQNLAGRDLTIGPPQLPVIRDRSAGPRSAQVTDSGATAVGGNVFQSGVNVAGRDLTKIEKQTINNITQLAPAAREAVRQLPGDVSEFTDREDVLAQIRARFQRGGAQARVALCGAPGVGKSAVAIHAAHLILPSSLTGSCTSTSPARRTRRRSSRARRWRCSCGRSASPTARSRSWWLSASWYRSLLADRRALVVLDNARNESQVRPLLPGGRQCAVLITSRAPLVGLDGCWPCELPELDRDASVEMLGKIIGADRVAQEPAAADRIAGLCGDLPLAVRIGGALLAKRPAWKLERLRGILADERQRLQHLEGGGLNIRASFSVSYQQLTDNQKRLFRRLAALPGQDFTGLLATELVEQDVDETQRLLEQLLDAHLIESPVDGRYALHDLLRLYAHQRFTEEEPPDAQQTARTATLGWYLMIAHATRNVLTPTAGKPPADPAQIRAAVDFAEAESENIVAAAQAALDRKDWETTIALAGAAYGVFELRSRSDEWERITRLGLQAALDSGDRCSEGTTLTGLGNVYMEQGRLDEAFDAHQQSLAICREFGDRRGEGQALSSLGIVYMERGRLDEAFDAHQQSLAICREFGDRRAEGTALGNLGNVYNEQGRWHEAFDAHQQSLAICREFGDRRGESQTLTGLGNVYNEQGRWQEAIDAYQRSLAICRELGDRRGEGHTLTGLGNLCNEQGRWQEAIDAYQRSLAICRELGDRRGEGQTLTCLGNLCKEQGRWQQASTPTNRASRSSESWATGSPKAWPSATSTSSTARRDAWRKRSTPTSRAWRSSESWATGSPKAWPSATSVSSTARRGAERRSAWRRRSTPTSAAWLRSRTRKTGQLTKRFANVSQPYSRPQRRAGRTHGDAGGGGPSAENQIATDGGLRHEPNLIVRLGPSLGETPAPTGGRTRCSVSGRLSPISYLLSPQTSGVIGDRDKGMRSRNSRDMTPAQATIRETPNRPPRSARSRYGRTWSSLRSSCHSGRARAGPPALRQPPQQSAPGDISESTHVIPAPKRSPTKRQTSRPAANQT